MLLYVSWGIFSEIRTVKGVSFNTNTFHKDISIKNVFNAFWRGLAITTFNPFTVVWWIGIITPMMAANQNYILFSFAVLVGSSAWFVLLAILLRMGRKFFTQTNRKWIVGASGLGVLGYSLYFFWRFLLEIL